MENIQEKIKKSYIRHIAEHQQSPKSILGFMEAMGAEEKNFYEHFNSFAAVEEAIWADFMKHTVDRVMAEEVFNQYSAREKLLSLFYTLIEVLKENRSFVVKSFKRTRCDRRPVPKSLQGFKSSFMDFAHSALNEGMDSGEVMSRPFISDRYADALWVDVLFVINFWINDMSANFEKTDAAIEKALNLAFDVFGRTPVDSAIDFAKFLWQNRKG